jgi:hypothetical protein
MALVNGDVSNAADLNTEFSSRQALNSLNANDDNRQQLLTFFAKSTHSTNPKVFYFVSADDYRLMFTAVDVLTTITDSRTINVAVQAVDPDSVPPDESVPKYMSYTDIDVSFTVAATSVSATRFSRVNPANFPQFMFKKGITYKITVTDTLVSPDLTESIQVTFCLKRTRRSL